MRAGLMWVNLIFAKIKKVISEQLTQGVTPRGLAMTCGFALSLSIFPFIGTTTLLCLLFGNLFKLNQPLLHALNYIFYPLQFICIPLFLYVGESILGVPHLAIHPTEMVQQFTTNWQQFLQLYTIAGLQALLAWFFIAPFMGLITFYLLRPILEKTNRKETR